MEGHRTPAAGEPRAHVDHALLVAMVAVRQAGTRTARIAGRIAVRDTAAEPVHALVATLLHADHAAAARTLHGSFHPRIARATRQAASTNMKAGFTLAF